MLTDVLARRRRRTARSLSQLEIELYRDLARTSGGQTIEVTKSDLSLATTVIEDSTATAVVRHQVIPDWRWCNTFANCVLLCFSTKLCLNCSHSSHPSTQIPLSQPFVFLPLPGDGFPGSAESWEAWEIYIYCWCITKQHDHLHHRSLISHLHTDQLHRFRHVLGLLFLFVFHKNLYPLPVSALV